MRQLACPMTIDEFIARAEAQPEVVRERLVRIWGPQLSAEIAAGRLRNLAEIYAHPDQTSEPRIFRYGHSLGPALRSDEILLRANWIHVWADLDVGRAYFGLAPLAEWEDASRVGWASMFEVPPRGAVAISYHENGDDYLVLDTAASEYRWYDLQDFDSPRRVGSTVSHLLEWLLNAAQALDPRRERAG
jgi:hypothetical protein